MIQVHVRYFAAHRDITGHSEEHFQLMDGASVGDLWQVLVAQYPRLAGFEGSLLYAVNEEFSQPGDLLADGDTVAFIPPVSGGAPERFAVSPAPLDAAALQRLVAAPDMGAVVTFLGVVRDNFGGKATAYLEYEAYAPMAVKVLRQIAQDAQGRWQIGQVAIHHRVGRLEIGEAAVAIVVAAPHRHAAFEATEWLMDQIKAVVPIWKRECWADGTSEWVGGEQQRRPTS